MRLFSSHLLLMIFIVWTPFLLPMVRQQSNETEQVRQGDGGPTVQNINREFALRIERKAMNVSAPTRELVIREEERDRRKNLEAFEERQKKELQENRFQAKAKNSAAAFLNDAAQRGDVQRIRDLLRKGVQVDARCLFRTPLLRAASEGHIAAVRVLVEAGACLEARNDIGRTPLYIAAVNGRKDVVEYLLSKGAMTHITCLVHDAAYAGHTEIIDVLHRVTRIPLNSRDDERQATPLHCAASSDKNGTIRYLLSKGSDIEAADNKGQRPIHYAARWSHRSAISELLQAGANVNAQDSEGNTPLHYDLRGEEKVVELLLSNGADISAKNKKGRTPLFFAKKAETVRELLRRGASVTCRDEKGATPLHSVSKHSESSDAINALINAGISVTATDKFGGMPLHYAACGGNKTATEVLVNRVVGVDCRDVHGNTPLHYAASRAYGWNPRYLSIITFLVDRGADVNAVNNTGHTPLHYCAKNGNIEAIKFLLAREACKEIVGNDGNTPALYAVNLETIDLLMGSD